MIIILLSDKNADCPKVKLAVTETSWAAISTLVRRIMSRPKDLSSQPRSICQNRVEIFVKTGRVWRNEERTKMKGANWVTRTVKWQVFWQSSWETFLDILNKLSTGDTAGGSFQSCDKWTWSNFLVYKNFTHWYVEAGMHARGGEVVHVSIVAPDQLR